MFGPGDLIRLPADAVNGILRLVDEVVLIRTLLQDEVVHMRGKLDEMDDWLHEDVNQLKEEFAHVRERVDELADTIPTATRGPIEKVKDALTPDYSDD